MTVCFKVQLWSRLARVIAYPHNHSESNCLSTQSLNTNIRLPGLEFNKFDGGLKKTGLGFGTV